MLRLLVTFSLNREYWAEERLNRKHGYAWNSNGASQHERVHFMGIIDPVELRGNSVRRLARMTNWLPACGIQPLCRLPHI